MCMHNITLDRLEGHLPTHCGIYCCTMRKCALYKHIFNASYSSLPNSFIITRITRKQGSACLPAVRYLVGRILHRKHKGVGSIPVVGMLHCVSDNVPV